MLSDMLIITWKHLFEHLKLTKNNEATPFNWMITIKLLYLVFTFFLGRVIKLHVHHLYSRIKGSWGYLDLRFMRGVNDKVLIMAWEK